MDSISGGAGQSTDIARPAIVNQHHRDGVIGGRLHLEPLDNDKGPTAQLSVRDKIRLLILHEVRERRYGGRHDAPPPVDTTQTLGPRNFMFETQPGRPWEYVVDAPPGHGAEEPMVMVPAIGISVDSIHTNTRISALRSAGKHKLKGAVALVVQSRLRAKRAQEQLEAEPERREAIHVDFEMISISSSDGSWSQGGYDEVLIPMFAPLEDGPPPIVEMDQEEEYEQRKRRRERRRSSFDAEMVAANLKNLKFAARRRSSGASAAAAAAAARRRSSGASAIQRSALLAVGERIDENTVVHGLKPETNSLIKRSKDDLQRGSSLVNFLRNRRQQMQGKHNR